MPLFISYVILYFIRGVVLYTADFLMRHVKFCCWFEWNDLSTLVTKTKHKNNKHRNPILYEHEYCSANTSYWNHHISTGSSDRSHPVPIQKQFHSRSYWTLKNTHTNAQLAWSYNYTMDGSTTFILHIIGLPVEKFQFFHIKKLKWNFEVKVTLQENGSDSIILAMESEPWVTPNKLNPRNRRATGPFDSSQEWTVPTIRSIFFMANVFWPLI